jgi:hypothetical protein
MRDCSDEQSLAQEFNHESAKAESPKEELNSFRAFGFRAFVIRFVCAKPASGAAVFRSRQRPRM